MWYISYLIKHSHEIRQSFYESSTGHSKDEIDHEEYGFIYAGTNDDTYSDLLLLESSIDTLYSDKKLSNSMYKVIRYYLYGDTVLLSRKYRMNAYESVRHIIEIELPYFSDEKFLERMREDYCLTKQEIDQVRSYLQNTRKKDEL